MRKSALLFLGFTDDSQLYDIWGSRIGMPTNKFGARRDDGCFVLGCVETQCIASLPCIKSIVETRRPVSFQYLPPSMVTKSSKPHIPQPLPSSIRPNHLSGNHLSLGRSSKEKSVIQLSAEQ